jgi:uncharacterized SAM-binding protein YcdF (DUF218 family)
MPRDTNDAKLRILFVPSCEVRALDKLLGTETETRLAAALYYWARGDYDYIAVTGGVYLSPEVQKTPSGELMARWLEEHGVSPDRVLVEITSRDTFENVSGFLDLCRTEERTAGRVLDITVITHWQHARRFWLTFRAWKIKIHTIPLDYRIGFVRRVMEYAFLLVHLLDPRGTGWLASKNRRNRTQTD